ncbi:MAG: alpha-L-fucosidase [Clostridia bacterium]|nr:alpha-L-fucosidase [Clostridia bacterium]
MWYSSAYRRHLCDMHVDDWDESFLSRFSPEEYVENLKTAKIQNAMLYLQSHVGLCYYPTDVGVMHRAFRGREDMMKRTEALCHQNGIAVTGYYSLNYNTAEHDRHPSWRMVEKNGRSLRENLGASAAVGAQAFASLQGGRYGLCCPNNMEYRAFVYRQIDEMLDYFKVEGFFFDMPFWSHTCYCDKCRARWEKEVGRAFPADRPKREDPDYLVLMRKKHQWMGEWIAAVTAYVKKKSPTLSVEHNFAQGIASDAHAGCGPEVNAACDFVGGDLYGGIFNHSLACKFYLNITNNQPFDYMFSRCKPALRSHTLTKSEDEMLVEVLSTTAHHGATMVIDAIDPVGTLDRRVYERIGRVFEREIPYEPYLKGKMQADVGLYYSTKSRFDRDFLGADSKSGCIGALKGLIGAHIPFEVTGSYHTLDGYRMLVIPMLSEEENDDARILSFVQNGGAVYFSGARNASLLQALTGGTCTGYTCEKDVYVAPVPEAEELFGGFNAAYPLPVEARAPKVQGVTNGRVLATLTLPYTTPEEVRFASIHSNPPGKATAIPAMVEGTYGKGRFIWSALPLESVCMSEYHHVVVGCVKRLLGDVPLAFCSDAEDVEITLFEDNDCFYVNAVHLDERVKMPILSPFEVGVRYAGEVRGVELLPTREPVSFARRGEYVYFDTKPMHVFDMYRILK